MLAFLPESLSAEMKNKSLEPYRSGHNEAHSKCVYRHKRYQGSNPCVSVQWKPEQKFSAPVFLLFSPVFLQERRPERSGRLILVIKYFPSSTANLGRIGTLHLGLVDVHIVVRILQDLMDGSGFRRRKLC